MAVFRWPVGWDPMSGLRLMQREFDRVLGRGDFSSRGIGGGAYPCVNVLNGPDEIIVQCELCGVDREDIDLSITGETLVIKGQKGSAPDEECKYIQRERGIGEFSRTIILPDKIEPEQIQAKLDAGILTIALPKSETARPKQIEVK